jgi:hypothetical protein
MRRFQRFDLGSGDLIVAVNLQVYLWVKLAETLHQIVGEGVVIIDNKDHGES